MRTCVGCRARRPQEELLRLRWDGTRVAVEAAGRRGPGRGAYLCGKLSCWEAARRRRVLGRALRRGALGIDELALAGAVAGMISGSPGPAAADPQPLI